MTGHAESQLRAHFEDGVAAGKPVVVGEFGKLHHGGMHRRREFFELVYAEVEAWNAKHGNVAGVSSDSPYACTCNLCHVSGQTCPGAIIRLLTGLHQGMYWQART